jgi:hypothetical protein
MCSEGLKGISYGGEQLTTVVQRSWYIAGIFYVTVELRDCFEHCDDAGHLASDEAGWSAQHLQLA